MNASIDSRIPSDRLRGASIMQSYLMLLQMLSIRSVFPLAFQ